MAINPSDLSGFATTGTEAQLSGQSLDLDFQMQQLPGDVKGVSKIKAADIAVKRDPLKSKGLGVEATEEEDETTTDALTALRRSVSNVSSSPATFDVSPTLTPSPGSEYSVNTDVAPMDIPTNIGVLSANQGLDQGLRNQDDEYFNYIDELSKSYQAAPEKDYGQTSRDIAGGLDFVGKGIDYAGDRNLFGDSALTNKPITGAFGKTLPGYKGSTSVSTAQYAQTNTAVANPYAASTLGGQIAGAGVSIASAYSAYDALKGGIDSPMEAAQLASGVIGTVSGLNAMGLISTPGFMAAAGPVGWALMGASFLVSTGLIGGGGKNKPPMGGVEVRLADESGKLYTTYEEGKNLKISAGAASSYNGFNSQAMKNQTQKNIDYMYAFADEFGLKVNEKAWSEAAFGPKKYLPRGRGDPYRSVLEKIDSEGDGSSSPSEWLRHAMEYQSESGERIIDGDIYKGVRIGPNGLPMKVGYKTQESFQEAVADFNKKFYG